MRGHVRCDRCGRFDGSGWVQYTRLGSGRKVAHCEGCWRDLTAEAKRRGLHVRTLLSRRYDRERH